MGSGHFALKYSNRLKEVEGIDPRTGETVKKWVKLADWWLCHLKRTQYEGVRYMPYDDRDVVNGYRNLWTGFAVLPTKGEKHLSLLEHVKRNICRNNEEHYNYLIGWSAFAIQNRREKTGVAVVLKSEGEGTGKGTWLTYLGRLYGKHYRHVTQPEHLVGKFNAHLQACSFVFADEAFFAGDRRHESVLKTVITENEIQVEPKGLDLLSVPNFMNVALASNKSFVVPAGPTSRRYFVLDVAEDNMQDSEFFAKIRDDMDKHGGRSHLLHYLLTYDLTGFDVRKVPVTDALKEQRAHSRKGIDSLVETVARNGVLPFAHYKKPSWAVTSGARANGGFWAHCRDTYPDLKFSTPENMMRDLRDKWGCDSRSTGGRNYCIFPVLSELRRRFDKHHGKQDWTRGPAEWQALTAYEPDGNGQPRDEEFPL